MELRSDNNLFDTLSYNTTIKYSALEIPLGARYYSFFKKERRMFVNVIVTDIVSINSQVDMGYKEPFKISPLLAYAAGAGFEVKKVSAEFRYTFCKDLLNYYPYWRAPYSRISLVLGYRIF